jgi:hypothetical protein
MARGEDRYYNNGTLNGSHTDRSDGALPVRRVWRFNRSLPLVRVHVKTASHQ